MNVQGVNSTPSQRAARPLGMTPLSLRIWQRYFKDDEHPFQRFEREVDQLLRPEDALLDAGCGRSAPVLVKYRGRAARLIGIDVVEFTGSIEGIELYKGDLASIPLENETVDLIMARSVMEHIGDPVAVYAEFARVLKPGGRVIFITANLWDYASIGAAIVPNKLHPWLVARIAGRKEQNVFPIEYKTNTRRAIHRLAADAGLRVEQFEYLGQYPCYFAFNGVLFLLATAYEKLITAWRPLHGLRGWILCTLVKPDAAGS